MKILKVTTHWSTEEADAIYRLLDDLQTGIWESYGHDIEQLYAHYREELHQREQQLELEIEESYFDSMPF